MRNRQSQNLACILEKDFFTDFSKQNPPQESAYHPYEDIIRELDAIFDRIHGGRENRYSC